jgi:histone H2B
MAGKTPTKKIVKRTDKKVRRKKFDSYSVYIYRVLKNIHGEIGISKRAMGVMNSFVADLFERVALEASKLNRYQRKHTISSGDIQAAVKLILPGDLAEHAIAEGTRALGKFSNKTTTN